MADGESMFTFYGQGFNYPQGVPIADVEGVITGRLFDGGEFSWRYSRSETATILLVPEPIAITSLLPWFAVVTFFYRGKLS